MTEGLSVVQIAILSFYALGMSGGQILFKLAAMGAPAKGPFPERFFGLMQSSYFLSALAAYSALSIIWVWILTFTPLSRAYPFVALAFVLTPVLGGLLFAEPLTTRLAVGVAVILCGLFLVAG
jgi:drug/metabolite transporter (DMT)-like permease